MIRKLLLSVILASGFACSSIGQLHYDLPSAIEPLPVRQINGSTYRDLAARIGTSEPTAIEPISIEATSSKPLAPSPYTLVVPWQEQAVSAAAAGGGSGQEEGGDAGAGAAVNPSVPLSQIQFQNVFIPESFDSHGYANQFVVQPVIAINRNPDKFFPYHVIRATLPILAPEPDPDGIVPDRGGVGDTTYFDLYFHPTKKKGVTWGIGPVAILPTSTDTSLIFEGQLGLGEWQLGPSAAYINASRKNWVFGGLIEAPFSLESDSYSILYQPILTRLLKNEKYVGIGDLLWQFNDENGNYNLPISFRFGKVFTAGKQPINIFVQPELTPRGFSSVPTSKYGFKLSITFLLPGAKFGYDKEKAALNACTPDCFDCVADQ